MNLIDALVLLLLLVAERLEHPLFAHGHFSRQMTDSGVDGRDQVVEAAAFVGQHRPVRAQRRQQVKVGSIEDVLDLRQFQPDLVVVVQRADGDVRQFRHLLDRVHDALSI